MSQDTAARYYLALVASGFSVLGWFGVVAFGLYAAYRLVTGDPVYEPAIAILISFAVGVAFALIEKRLYRPD